ncbi:MAG: helix-turn-helix domain-containing protein, partial [Pedobacter sp.]
MKSTKYYKTKEVQKLLGISKHTVWRYIKSGKLEGIKKGKNWLIPAEQLGVQSDADVNKAPNITRVNFSPKQKQILTTLNKRYGKGFADIYESIQFLFQFQPPDWEALLSHEIRELINLIPIVVLEDQLKKREYGKQIIQLIQNNVEDLRTVLSAIDKSEQITLSKGQQRFFNKLIELTDQLIYANNNPEALMESIRALSSSNPYITAQEKSAVAKNIQYIHEAIGPRPAHHEWIQQKDSKLKPSTGRYLDILSTLDDLLYGLIAEHRFVGDLNEIDEILKIDHPSDDDAKRLKQMIKLDPEKQSTESKIRYVFEKCRNPVWIKKLYDFGFFNAPPEIKKEGEYIQTPVWAQSQSLIHIVTREKDFVLKIITQFQYIKNPRVIEDFVSASLLLDISGLKRVAELAIQNEWVKIPYAHKLFEYLTDLAGKLIVHDQFTQLGW